MSKLPSYQSKKAAYNSVFGGFLIHIMIGTFYLWGNINTYITSYLRQYNPDLTIDTLNSNFPFMGLTLTIFTPFGLSISFKFGIKKTLWICSIGCFLIEIPEENEGEIDELLDENDQMESLVVEECKDIKMGLKPKLIYYTLGLMVFYAAQGQLTIDNFKPIGQQMGGFSDIYLTLVGSIASLFNGFVRIVWGKFLDVYGFKKLAIFNLILEFIFMFFLIFFCSSEIVFIICILGIMGCFGGWSAKMPALLAQIYGKQIGSSFYGITIQGLRQSV
ncbi:major facilitator superfamily protein, putative [Ichthyophthirius multifiliis]|uniref:Major facilitator superfamily protein, putative n=1 Tax=Ichthyophthirius multifiliis TaxID=5932 RepID=G0R3F1_ICHMU|nr:major facilitator superfamily protein, putative [Ichthyophthirius multifiliis]EGR28002.1 major facilitator superfamily protein, putative [Ichthyophthirius multifiliis]|eukprot:XP_004027347.1 major facilitator superfamily protein, putative [Ichthyophthirius multifiliis]